jgi:transposase InsO family protein
LFIDKYQTSMPKLTQWAEDNIPVRPRKRHYYPNAGTTHKKAENLLNREFEQQTLNTHWVGDIT